MNPTLGNADVRLQKGWPGPFRGDARNGGGGDVLFQPSVFAGLKLADGFDDLFLGVHDVGAAGGDWFVDRLAAEEQQDGIFWGNRLILSP